MMIEDVALCSLMIIGIYVVTREEMFLNFISIVSVKILGEKWSSPITECPICMASAWGFIYFCVIKEYDIKYLPAFMLMVAGLNSILISLWQDRNTQADASAEEQPPPKE